MAKTGFWLRNAKGKLAGATVYQQNGETVMREIVTPSNPKTERQIIQRIIMHTVMQAYSKMKAITDHSFEGFKKGQETMSYFMKRNVQICRDAVARMQSEGVSFVNMFNFVPLGRKGFTPNQYQIAMGSLPTVNVTLRDDDEAKGFVPAITTNTYQAVIDALGIQRGDQLTFIMIDQNTDAEFGQCNFHFCRVILDPTNTDYSQAALSSQFVDANGDINLPSVRNEGAFKFAVSANGLSFMYNGSLTCTCAAVIVSRQVNGNWLRSTTYLAYSGLTEYSMQDCIDAAGNGTVQTIYAPSEQYLNNAGQGGGIGAVESGGSSSSGGSGGNSGTTPSTGSVSITSASAGNQAMVVGTKKNIGLDSLPAAVNVRVEASNANGYSVVVNDGTDDVATQAFANGVAAVNCPNCAAGKTYTLILRKDGQDTATGYSFGVYEDSFPG